MSSETGFVNQTTRTHHSALAEICLLSEESNETTFPTPNKSIKQRYVESSTKCKRLGATAAWLIVVALINVLGFYLTWPVIAMIIVNAFLITIPAAYIGYRYYKGSPVKEEKLPLESSHDYGSTDNASLQLIPNSIIPQPPQTFDLCSTSASLSISIRTYLSISGYIRIIFQEPNYPRDIASLIAKFYGPDWEITSRRHYAPLKISAHNEGHRFDYQHSKHITSIAIRHPHPSSSLNITHSLPYQTNTLLDSHIPSPEDFYQKACYYYDSCQRRIYTRLETKGYDERKRFHIANGLAITYQHCNDAILIKVYDKSGSTFSVKTGYTSIENLAINKEQKELIVYGTEGKSRWEVSAYPLEKGEKRLIKSLAKDRYKALLSPDGKKIMVLELDLNDPKAMINIITTSGDFKEETAPLLPSLGNFNRCYDYHGTYACSSDGALLLVALRLTGSWYEDHLYAVDLNNKRVQHLSLSTHSPRGLIKNLAFLPGSQYDFVCEKQPSNKKNFTQIFNVNIDSDFRDNNPSFISGTVLQDSTRNLICNVSDITTNLYNGHTLIVHNDGKQAEVYAPTTRVSIEHY